MKILADANYFLALVNSKDPNYTLANSISKRIRKQKDVLVLNEYIFLETITVASQRLGKEIAIELGKSLSDPIQFLLIVIDGYLFEETRHIFEEIENKNVSFADCSLIATMKNKKISNLLSFDRTDFVKLQKRYKFKLLE